MIKCDNGNIEITGMKSEILADLSTMVHVLHFNVFIENRGMTAEESRKMILDSVEIGFLSESEAKEKLCGGVKDNILKVLDELKELLSRKDDE